MKLQRLLLPPLVLAGLVLVAEGTAWLALYAKYRENLPSLYAKLASTLDPGRCSWGDQITIQPYLGLRYHQFEPCRHPLANQRGMVGEDIPLKLDRANVNVLLLGGSVAEGLFATGKIEDQLNQRYPLKRGRFKVWNASMTAGQQPRQAIAHLMHGSQFDAVISLEGFNEHFNVKAKFPLEQPPNSWHHFERLIHQKFRPPSLKADLVSSAQSALKKISTSSFRHSHFIYLLLSSVAALPVERDQLNAPLYPSAQPVNLEDYAESYADVLRSMAAVAKQRQQLLHVFFQPAPALYKTLTEAEQAVVGDLSYGPTYLKLVQLTSLKINQTVRHTSLLEIFKQQTDSIYVDLIHFSATSKANDLIAEAIADQIGPSLKALDAKRRPGR